MLLLSRAFSKTADVTAFQLAKRKGVEVIGLIAKANVDFCESLGCYQRVLTYQQLDQIARDTPCAFIDFAGNSALRMRTHSQFANLKYSCSVGGTHVDLLGNNIGKKGR